MKKTLTVLLAIMLVMGIFCSCGSKKYKEFETDGNFIVLPLPEDLKAEYKQDTVRFPLFLYKAAEIILEPALKDLIAFKPISDAKIEMYEDGEDNLMMTAEKTAADEGINLNGEAPEWIAKMTDVENNFLEEMVYFIDDYLWEIADILEDVEDWDVWYDDPKQYYEEETEGIKTADEFMKLWFPQFTYLPAYEASEFAKTAKSTSSSLDDALNSAAKEYEDALNSVVKEYEDALNDLDLDSYADLYSDTLDAYSDLYGDAYSDALDSYADAYSDALNSYADALSGYSSLW